MENTISSYGAESLFGLLRHGETEWNTQKRIQGLGDSPLTQKGRSQIRQWAKTLSQYEWDQIYASDLGRVRQTVAILNDTLQLPTYFDERLREQNWGDWEGLTLSSIKNNHKKELAERVALGWEFSAPGGETRTSVLTRIFNALRNIAKDTPSQKTLIVCHQGVIKVILYHLAGRQFLPEEDTLIRHNNFHLVGFNNEAFNICELNIPRQQEK